MIKITQKRLSNIASILYDFLFNQTIEYKLPKMSLEILEIIYINFISNVS